MTEEQLKYRLGVLVVTPIAWKFDKTRCQAIINEMSPAPGEDEVKPLQDQGKAVTAPRSNSKAYTPRLRRSRWTGTIDCNVIA
jgi:hypothetical protein